MNYPDKLEIIPLEKPPRATIRVPGSKSITNRALVLAALASNPAGCELEGALQSEDTKLMVDALRQLGFVIETDWDRSHIRVSRQPGADIIPARQADLFVGNSGTTMRFLTALVSLGHGSYRLDGIPRMRERPIQDLLDALQQLGVNAYGEMGTGYPPVAVQASGLNGGTVRIKGDVSSQFLSGLLMAAPRALQDLKIEVQGPLVSEPYVLLTVEMMRAFGAQVFLPAPAGYDIPGGQHYSCERYHIEPDASAASYFLAAAAITGGTVTILDLSLGKPPEEGRQERSLQGDVAFAECLREMGCDVASSADGITVSGRPPHGIDVDMNGISDTVMTLAAVACFAEGPTTIRNVAHIRHKETDRLAALAAQLRRVGALVEDYPDGLKITPRPLHPAEIETYDDHRLAMSMALLGLKVPGIVIKDPGCVAKTYPGFWQDLEKLRQENYSARGPRAA